MNSNIPSYRITGDDLPDADKKTQKALEPLFDALNRTMGQVIAAFGRLFAPPLKETSFTTDASGVAYVDLKLGAPASELWVTGLTQERDTINFVYSYSWIATATGARILFVGLATSTAYSLKVRYL